MTPQELLQQLHEPPQFALPFLPIAWLDPGSDSGLFTLAFDSTSSVCLDGSGVLSLWAWDLIAFPGRG